MISSSSVIGSLRALEAVDGAFLLAVFGQRGDVDALAVVEAAIPLADADDLVARLMHEQRRVRAHVAEALDDDAGLFLVHLQVLDGFVGDDHHAAAGGFAASARSAHVQRLAGDDGGDGLPHVHGVGVHHPCHGLLVGVDVGSGNVFFGADELDQLGGVAAGHALQFAARHVLGIADDAALGAAEGDVHHRALPGHPTGQGADFVERDVGSIADAALGRAARDGVLHAVAGEDFELPVVHHDRDVDDDFAVGLLQHAPQARIEIELFGGDVEARGLCFPRIFFLFERQCGFHKNSPRIAMMSVRRDEISSQAGKPYEYMQGRKARKRKSLPMQVCAVE